MTRLFRHIIAKVERAVRSVVLKPERLKVRGMVSSWSELWCRVQRVTCVEGELERNVDVNADASWSSAVMTNLLSSSQWTNGSSKATNQVACSRSRPRPGSTQRTDGVIQELIGWLVG